jgi:hypothetical protein
LVGEIELHVMRNFPTQDNVVVPDVFPVLVMVNDVE